MKQVQNNKFRPLLMPISRATAFTSNYTSMRSCKRAVINVMVGTAADASFELKLLQAKDVAGVNSKALAFSTGDAHECLSTGNDDAQDKWTESTVASSGTTSANIALAASTWYKVDIRNDQLDANNDFDCIAVLLDSISGAELLAVWIELIDYAYKGDPSDMDIMPSAAINSQATLS